MKGARALVLALALLGCGESEAEREERAMKEAVRIRVQPDGSIKLTSEEERALGLATAAAEEGELAEDVTRFGVVLARPDDEAIVAMPLAGRVDKAKGIELGAEVRAGDLLGTVTAVLGAADHVALASQRATLEGQIAAARADLKTQESELARGRKLQSEGLVTAQEVLRLETTVVTSRAQLDGLAAARRAHDRGDGARVDLRSPVAGRIVSLEGAVGLTLPAGRTVTRVLRRGGRWIDVAVPFAEPIGATYDAEAARGTAGVPARLLARGAIVADDGMRRDRIALEGDADAGAGQAFIPGATVAVRVHGFPSKGVVVAAAALVATADGPLVFVRVGEGTFAPRRVTVGARREGQALVTNGVAARDVLVVRGAAGLRGETIRAELRHQE